MQFSTEANEENEDRDEPIHAATLMVSWTKWFGQFRSAFGLLSPACCFVSFALFFSTAWFRLSRAHP
jgi:hypothetical protein